MTKQRLGATARMMTGVLLVLTLAMVSVLSSPVTAYAQCGGTITVGSPIRDSISSRYPSCDYRFYGNTNDVVTIRMTKVSSSLDPWLDVFAPGDRRPAVSDDDSGGNNNSLIGPYSLLRTGWYTIRAGSWRSTSGVFELSIGQSGLISNQLSGKCIDVQGSPGTVNGSALQLWDCEFSGRGLNDSVTDQKWEITSDGYIRNQLSGKCIDVQGSPGTVNRSALQLWDCEFSGRGPSNSVTDQKWEITSDGYIRNQLSGKCIDVQGSPGTVNRSALQLWDCEFSGRGLGNSVTDQRWRVQ